MIPHRSIQIVTNHTTALFVQKRRHYLPWAHSVYIVTPPPQFNEDYQRVELTNLHKSLLLCGHVGQSMRLFFR